MCVVSGRYPCLYTYFSNHKKITVGQQIDNNFGLVRVSLGHTKTSSINILPKQHGTCYSSKLMKSLDSKKI